MNTKTTLTSLGVALTLATAQSVFAANDHAGGHAGGGGGNAGGNAGGMSQSHMSATGLSNTNAQFLSTSTRGLDRAQLRMSVNGQENEHTNLKTETGTETESVTTTTTTTTTR